MPTLHRDYETKSTVDLPKTGVHVYAEHPTTDVWCMAYAVDDEPVKLWIPGQPCPSEFIACATEPGWIAVAHNDSFESTIEAYIMRSRYGWPIIPQDRHRCTMTEAYAMALPGSLENAAAALGIGDRKDMDGRKVMMQMSKPRRIEPDGTIIWWNDDERKRKLYHYCMNDVVVERAVDKRLLRLSAAEQRLWHVDQRINNRGIFVDLPAVRQAIQLVTYETERLNFEMSRVTSGEVPAVSQAAKLLDWCARQGVALESMEKDLITATLRRDDLPPKVFQALTLRHEGAKTSTAKFKTLLAGTGADGRFRGALQYHGATTGRWAGRRLGQNLPRPEVLLLEDGDPDQHAIESVVDSIATMTEASTLSAYLDMFYGAVMSVLADCIRAFLTAAPGYRLVSADFSNIEGRVLAWLAGETTKIQRFIDYDAGIGDEIYKLTAADVLSVIEGQPRTAKSISKTERQMYGKTTELSFGFGGAVGAYRKMARGKDKGLADKAINRTVKAWRIKHPRTKAYWKELERAAIAAVRQPGSLHDAGAEGRKIKFRMSGSFLFAQLPSSRCLVYPYPRLTETILAQHTDSGSVRNITERERTAYETATRIEVTIAEDGTETHETVAAYNVWDATQIVIKIQANNQWLDDTLTSVDLCENITQAVARDLLAAAILRLEQRGYPVVFHQHDEAISEVPEGFGSVAEYEAIMCESPAWAAGLPVAASGWEGRRYRK